MSPKRYPSLPLYLSLDRKRPRPSHSHLVPSPISTTLVLQFLAGLPIEPRPHLSVSLLRVDIPVPHLLLALLTTLPRLVLHAHLNGPLRPRLAGLRDIESPSIMIAS